MKDHNKEIRSLTESVNNMYEAPLHEGPAQRAALIELLNHLWQIMGWENEFGRDRPIYDPDTGDYWPVPRLSPAEERQAEIDALKSTAGSGAVFD